MRQFIGGTDSQYADLEHKARAACVVFSDQEMPAGATPGRARIGFEVNPANGRACLLVDRGISYSGQLKPVADWLDFGEVTFPSFTHLRDWIRTCLASAYAKGSPAPLNASPDTVPRAPGPVDPAILTEVSGVRVPSTFARVRPEELAAILKRAVRGQGKVLDLMAGEVTLHLAKTLRRRPLSLCLVGPTGTGKTLAASSLGDALRELLPDGQGYDFLRLDMCEFAERHRVSQLLGAPQGYVGYGDGSQLSSAIAANPRQVILFDEIEKAHPDIFVSLMNVLDYGRISTPSRTAAGWELNFTEAILLFTSNLAATEISRIMTTNPDADPVTLDALSRGHFANHLRPELVGRIRRFLPFRNLRDEEHAEVVALSVHRIGREYGLDVVWIEPDVIGAILGGQNAGRFGNRPAEYLVDHLLGEAFADAAARLGSQAVVVTGGPPFACVTVGEHKGRGAS